MKKYPLYTALTQAYELHGLEISDDTFETYALSAYNKIGNKDYRLYKVRLHPVADASGGWYIEVPCNFSSVEAITLDFESAQGTHSYDIGAGAINQSIEQRIENNKGNISSFYIPGQLVKYKELGNRIYFNAPYDTVNLLYKGQYLDSEGLPYINDKELDAIVAYCVYAEDMKKARLTKDASTYQMAQLEYQLWQKACSNARTPIDISQNQMNEILDVMTSWNVHSYNASSTKPIQ